MKKYFKIFILILVLAFTCVLTGCKTPVNDVGDTINDLIVEKGEERGIRLTKRNVKNDDGSYTITATVTPAAASNNKLTWTLDCDDENFVDAYDISDFVQLTVSDDTLSANVKYLQAFPVQLKLIVSSISNPDVIATCTLDCYGRVGVLTHYGCDVDIFEFLDVYSTNKLFSIIDFTSVSYSSFFENEFMTLTFGPLEYEFIGSIDDNEVTITYFLDFDESLDAKTAELGYEELFEFFEIDCLNSNFHNNNGDVSVNLFNFLRDRSGLFVDGIHDKVLEVLFNCDYWFQLRIEFEVFDNDGQLIQTKSEYIRFKFDIHEVPTTAVTGVSLDHSSVVF